MSRRPRPGSTAGPTEPMNMTGDDARFMRRALRLAARGRGWVEPNPMVGCVIARGGRVTGEGYHHHFGGPHAEIEALRAGGDAARGATVYVSLEPCCHQGKTPPCTEALIAAGVGRVVAAMRDPNPLVAGRGLRRLKKAGISVAVGLLEREAAELNAPFIKLMHEKRPWVILKWAQSLDGKIATATGDSRWISDERMRAHAHRVRGGVDAIIVGWRTVARDDPLLTCRAGQPCRTPKRIILDAGLHTPATAQLIRTARETPTWIFCGPRAPRARVRKFQAAGCEVHPVPVGPGGTGVSLGAVLDVLGAWSLTNVLVEGGGRVLGSFFDERLADEVHIYIAPKLIGGATAIGPLHGEGASDIAKSLHLNPHAVLKALGEGWFIQARTHCP